MEIIAFIEHICIYYTLKNLWKTASGGNVKLRFRWKYWKRAQIIKKTPAWLQLT